MDKTPIARSCYCIFSKNTGKIYTIFITLRLAKKCLAALALPSEKNHLAICKLRCSPVYTSRAEAAAESFAPVAHGCVL